VDFEQTVRAVEAFAGKRVEVLALGPGEDAAPWLSLFGVLRRMEADFPLPAQLDGSEEGVIFTVGDNSLSLTLWPGRFIRATVMEDESSVEVVTRDCVLRVQEYRQPWA
jgi:hypothetical protein